MECLHLVVASKGQEIQTQGLPCWMKMNCDSCQIDGEIKIQCVQLGLILTKLGQSNAGRILIWKSILHLTLIKHFVNSVENFEEFMEKYRS